MLFALGVVPACLALLAEYWSWRWWAPCWVEPTGILCASDCSQLAGQLQLPTLVCWQVVAVVVVAAGLPVSAAPAAFSASAGRLVAGAAMLFVNSAVAAENAAVVVEVVPVVAVLAAVIPVVVGVAVAGEAAPAVALAAAAPAPCCTGKASRADRDRS